MLKQDCPERQWWLGAMETSCSFWNATNANRPEAETDHLDGFTVVICKWWLKWHLYSALSLCQVVGAGVV